MHIRFLMPWRNGFRLYDTGQEFPEFSGGLADELVRRGVAEEVKERVWGEQPEMAMQGAPESSGMLPKAGQRKLRR
jgi:hypothetical protein